MPVLNRRGEALCGVAGIGGSVEGTPYPFKSDGSGGWVTDDTIITQRSADSALVMWTRGDSHETLVDPRGGWVVAGGGRWQSFIRAAQSLIYGTALGEVPGAATYAMGLDGTLAWKPVYQSAGGLTLTAPDGSTVSVADAVPLDVHVLGPGRAVWSDARGTVRSVGLHSDLRPGATAGRTRFVVTADGTSWLVYWNDQHGLIAQVNGATTGYVLESRPTAFNHDAVAVGDDVVVAWSVTQGEGPNHLVKFVVNQQAVRCTFGQGLALPVTTINFGEPPRSTMSIPCFERPIWQAPFFSHSRQYGSTPLDQHAGNCAWVRTSEMDVAPPLPHITTVDDGNVAAANLNLTIAWLVSDTSIGALAARVNEALTYPAKPVVAYLDNLGWPEANPFTSTRVWPSIQAYPRVGESVDAFKARVEAAVVRVAAYGLPMVLTSRFDDTAGTIPVDLALQYMPVYEHLLREYYFVGHMPFSDRRGNAIATNPALWTWARAFQNAISLGRPNRYDYWQPSESSVLAVLRNKLGQSRQAVVLEPYLKAAILAKFTDASTPPPPPPSTPPRYRSQEDILPYLERRWVELGVPQQIAAVKQATGIQNDAEMTALRHRAEAGDADARTRHDAAEQKFREAQCPPFFQIIAELYWGGKRDVGLGKKTSGANWEGKATDVIVLKPLEGAGPVRLIDAMVANGYPDAHPGWSVMDFNPDRTWVEPPVAGGRT